MNRYEHDDTFRCYHCGNIVPMELSGREVSTWDEGEEYIGVEEWSFYMCPTCKEPTLICYFWQQKGAEIISDLGKTIAFPDNIFDNRSIPQNIRNAFQAASATKSMDVAISVIAWRRVLELTCKDLGAKGKNLYEKITNLSEEKVLPITLKEASHIIRNLGNYGAHDEADRLCHLNITKVEALVRYIIEYVYVLPQKMNDILASSDES